MVAGHLGKASRLAALFGLTLILMEGLVRNFRIVSWYHQSIEWPSLKGTGEAAPQGDISNSLVKFYVIPMPETTTWLVGNYSDRAFNFYDSSLNEQQAEVWLHRSFEKMTYEQGRTDDPAEADVFLICGYLHLNNHVRKRLQKEKVKIPPTSIPLDKEEWTDLVLQRLVNKTKPHVVAIPTWNPTVSRESGIAHLMKALLMEQVNVFSLGFERNQYWQRLSPDRILPVPYVVSPVVARDELRPVTSQPRTADFVFYAGDTRPNAVGWAGCNRSMILPLENRSDMDVRLVSGKKDRLTQEDYNRRMFESEYCLILCGDTPTSRSLTTSMAYGCLPVLVGTRLRGQCEPPCHPGWGWDVTGDYPHLPFEDAFDWGLVPALDEAAFAANPDQVLLQALRGLDPLTKNTLRDMQRSTQLAWLYGWGNPVNSTEFGEAANYAWKSMVTWLQGMNQTL